MKLYVLQHIPCETLGTIADALQCKGITPQYLRSFAGEPVPRDMADAAGLIIMGGPMGVYEQDLYPYLQDELRLIENALRQEKPVLGVCLGSQLLAAALGAQVKKNTAKEIGWYPITLTDSAREDYLWKGVEPSFAAFHWHGDIFDLPQGATSLASSTLTPCQAYRYGTNAYGLLFHMEVTREQIALMVDTFHDELQAERIDGRALVAQSETHLAEMQKIGATVYQRWAGLVDRV
jgi:GMP synthase (glutamine-hydrolysing)